MRVSARSSTTVTLMMAAKVIADLTALPHTAAAIRQTLTDDERQVYAAARAVLHNLHYEQHGVVKGPLPQRLVEMK